MPISDRRAYPLDWPFVAFNIVMRRAGGRCECTGECAGENGHLDPVDGRCRNRHGRPRWRGKPGQRLTILSAAHLGGDPSVSDPDELIAFCEGCHLRYDSGPHWATRRRREEERLGLVPLFDLVS